MHDQRSAPADALNDARRDTAHTAAATERPPVIGYAVREAGALHDATHAIGLWCVTHDWPLAKMVHDTGDQRPGLARAMDEIRAGRAAGLVAMRLRDLADSVTELGTLLRWFADGDSFLVALDTSSGPGGFAGGALAAISDWERDRVEGRGAAVRDDPELSALIAARRDDGMSLQAIADALNRGGVPTSSG